MTKQLNQQSGQVIIILLLIIVVSLSIGLSIIGRSTSEITNSSRTEDSQRAYFAAEAGIERAINSGVVGNLTLDNESEAEVKVDIGPTGNQGIEYPRLQKKDFAHIWLANPATLPNCAPADNCYIESSFDVYFGNEDLNAASPTKPAIEVNVVTRSLAGVYSSNRYYYDSDPSRATTNNFVAANPSCRQSYSANTIISPASLFYCKVTVPPNPCTGSCKGAYSDGNQTPVLVRIRLLYADGQKVAVVPVNNKPLPPQTKIYTSVGKAGNLQRVLRVIRESNVVPQMFDYALFSAADITK